MRQGCCCSLNVVNSRQVIPDCASPLRTASNSNGCCSVHQDNPAPAAGSLRVSLFDGSNCGVETYSDLMLGSAAGSRKLFMLQLPESFIALLFVQLMVGFRAMVFFPACHTEAEVCTSP